jgi:hypothetical protein
MNMNEANLLALCGWMGVLYCKQINQQRNDDKKTLGFVNPTINLVIFSYYASKATVMLNQYRYMNVINNRIPRSIIFGLKLG